MTAYLIDRGTGLEALRAECEALGPNLHQIIVSEIIDLGARLGGEDPCPKLRLVRETEGDDFFAPIELWIGICADWYNLNGPSSDQMIAAMNPFLASDPLCAKSRLVRFA